MFKITFIATLFLVLFAQSCSLKDSEKVDCGYFGINQQQCEAKKCCWVPTNSNGPLTDTPWCFYPSGQVPCQDINFSYSGGQSFTPDLIEKLKQNFMANINIDKKGGVAAAPDKNTPGGSYYYHWMRDAGLTMRLYQQFNEEKFSVIQSTMKSYVNFVLRAQEAYNPYPSDVRINPKFELPNSEVYVGGWCRPQTDGPALTAAALIMFGNNLLNNGQASYVKQYLWTDSSSSHHGGAIKYDLEWIISNWDSNGCDLWQEVQSSDFFWNRMSFVHALKLAETFASRMGDSSLSSRYASTRSAIEATLDGHWTGSYFTQSDNRKKDGAVIHALTSFPEKYGFTDSRIASTIKTLSQTFCLEYQINQDQNKNGIPGILIGRYPGDTYAGGNPWQLLTAVLAELFYKGATTMMESNTVFGVEEKLAWSDLLKINSNSSMQQFALAAGQAGDAVMFRLWSHVKNDGGRIDEQIGKNNGLQTSAKGLTWSYGNILRALQTRNGKLSQLLDKQEYVTQ